ncbi:hypothetical protein HY483_02365 [Candidatus Woesearchaeota archaeon]|nr:hypothetical protein [Candidatus Woesearchaeota archaeon]
MNTLLHIVHPYTWNLVGKSLVVGAIKEHSKRDKNIGTLGRTVLDTGGRILHYRSDHGQSIQGMLQNIALKTCPALEFLLDERVRTVVTTLRGCPLPDEKPEGIDEEKWKNLKEVYATQSALAEAVGTAELSIFIGGALEACLANTISFHNHYYRRNGEELMYIPELCATFDKERAKIVKKLLTEINVKEATYEEAMTMLRNGGRE